MKRAKLDVDLTWAERHRPRHLGQVVGNTEQVRKLAEWLRDWDDVVLKGKTKTPPEPEGKEWMKFRPAPENINARAALISGPPGIGKTTTSVLVAKCNPKYSCKEFNASDARSKRIVEEMSKSLAGNMTLKLGTDAKSALERSVIIMDECDGMSGGDIGGMQALIKMIETTKSPIICICNERGDQAVRSLANVCYDIKFKRPENTVVAKRMKAILEGEGKRADVTALESIVEACGHDIRQVLNQVQFFGTATAHAQGSQKDAQVQSSPFDACVRLLTKEDSRSKTNLPMKTKMDYFFIDADMVPLLIQENYLRPYERVTRTLEADDLNACASAAEMIATGDALQSSGDWSLQSSVAVIGTIYPSFLTAADGAPIRAAFPGWLQRRGGMKKTSRLAEEMYARVKPFTTCSRKDLMVSGYLDVLHRRMLRPLLSGDAKGCAALLHGYGLSREFFTDQAPAIRGPLNLDDGYKRVEGKARNSLLSELRELDARAEPTKHNLKRPREGDFGASRKRARGDTQGEAADEGEDEDGGKQKKDGPPKRKVKLRTGKEDDSKCSLGGWIKKEEKKDIHGNIVEGPPKRQVGILLKFIEGHTNAVRRQVHFDEIVGAWRQF